MAPLVLDKNSEQMIEDACRDAQGPVALKTGRETYVVMTASDYEKLESPLTSEELASLTAGIEDMRAGRTQKFSNALEEIRTSYGL